MELPHSYRGKRHVPVPSGIIKWLHFPFYKQQSIRFSRDLVQKSLMLIKGRFVVGCTDLMIGGPTKEDGCFLRIFYPTKLTDTYVNKMTSAKFISFSLSTNQPSKDIFYLYFWLKKANSNDWATWLPHRKYKEGYAIVRGLTSFLGKRVISWVFGKL